MADEAAKAAEVKRLEDEEQEKINNMSLAEATEYMRVSDGKKAKEAEEIKAKEEAEASARRKAQEESLKAAQKEEEEKKKADIKAA